MPPKKSKNSETPATTRRSTRIASRASSAAPEESTDEVIDTFATREIALREYMDVMEDQKERLTRERDEARSKKNNFRDKMFQQEMARKTFAMQQKKAAEEEEKAKQAASSTPPTNTTTTTTTDATAPTQAAPAPTPAPATDDYDESTHLNDSDMSIVQSTPLSQTAIAARGAQTEPKPRSFFGSLFSSIASPFTRGKKMEPTSATPQPQTLQKLGELPASRKRSAPAPEPATEPLQRIEMQQQPAQSHPTPRRQRPTQNTTGPRTPAAAQPRRQPTSTTHLNTVEPTLGTITEYTEPTEDTIIDPTPSRPPPVLSTHTQPAPHRHREISVMRRQMLNTRATTPSRAWDTKPTPREPNADRRLEKIRKFQELDQQLKAMKEDPETRELIERPLKRVKIDDLVTIPHNRPGDAPSTFRVPEVDSEEEMEIDEDDVALRSNVFEVDDDETPKAKEAPKTGLFSSVAKTPTPQTLTAPETQPQQQVVENRPPLNLQFPAIPQLPDGQENVTKEEARIKFEYGFKMSQLTGKLVPGLYGC